MINAIVCVDASMVVPLLAPEAFSAQAERLWAQWVGARVGRVAPSLLKYEVTGSLRKKARKGLLRADQAEAALARLFRLQIQFYDMQELHRQALLLAGQLNQPTAYDSHYLALAELLDCAFWTADERLFNGVKGGVERVRWIGAGDPGGAR